MTTPSTGDSKPEGSVLARGGPLGVGCFLASVLAGLCLLSGLLFRGQHEKPAERISLAVAAEKEAQSKQAAAEAKRPQAAAAVQLARATLERARSQFAARDGDGARVTAARARDTLQPFRPLQPPDPDVTAVFEEASELEARATRLGQAAGVLRDVKANLKPGQDILAWRDYMQDRGSKIDAFEADIKELLASEIRKSSVELRRVLAHAKSKIAKAERERAEAAALAIACGEKPPMIGSWDGELVGSEAFLARTAHDPDSIDVENCTVPTLTKKFCWVTTCQVRGKNAFGALVLNRVAFSVVRGEVVGAETL